MRFVGFVLFALVFGSFVLGCSSSARPESPPTEPSHAVAYHIVRDESFDSDLNSAYRVYLCLDAPLTRENVSSALINVRQDAARHGFVKHPNDYGVSAFLYSDEARAKAGGLIWVGRVDRSGGSGDEPRIEIRDDAISAINEPTVVRFGMTEPQRIAALQALDACQSKVNGPGDEGCIDMIRKQHKLSRKDFDSILDEAVHKQWPIIGSK